MAFQTDFSTRGSQPVIAEPTHKKLDDDAQLFSKLWPLGTRVTIDMTASQDIIRQQCDRLKALGYTFDRKAKVWNRAAETSDRS